MWSVNLLVRQAPNTTYLVRASVTKRHRGSCECVRAESTLLWYRNVAPRTVAVALSLTAELVGILRSERSTPGDAILSSR